MQFAENVLWLLVLIGVMIMIHELGHFWAARFFDVRVEAFSFGFGPRLFGFRRGETDFRFSLILFGGYVKMTGEQPGDEAVSDPRSFQAHPRWQRMCIAFAGPATNVVLAVVVLAGLYMADIAEKAGLQKGDILVSVNSKPIRSTSSLHEVISTAEGKSVQLVYARGGVNHTVGVIPEEREVDGQKRWMIGVALEPRVDIVKLSLPAAMSESVRQNLQSAKLIFKFLEGIVERRMSAKSLEGPIRIAQLSGQAAREGAATFLGLMSAVSLNLAIFNLLPIPILDGGVILLLLVEMLLRRDLDLKVK